MKVTNKSGKSDAACLRPAVGAVSVNDRNLTTRLRFLGENAGKMSQKVLITSSHENRVTMHAKVLIYTYDIPIVISSITKKNSIKKMKLPYDYLVLDLDETLYPSSLELAKIIRSRIIQFLQQYLQLDDEKKVWEVQHSLFSRYGTTLEGMIAECGYPVDRVEQYWDYIHESSLLKVPTNPELVQLLTVELKENEKVVFSNANDAHINATLDKLGLPRETFTKVVSVQTTGLNSKPSDTAFMRFLEATGMDRDQHTAVFLDDSRRNIEKAKSLFPKTWDTVLIDENHAVEFEVMDCKEGGERTRRDFVARCPMSAFRGLMKFYNQQ